jgi:hypothetical protein
VNGKALETGGPPSDYMIAIPSPDERRIAAIALTDIGTELRVVAIDRKAPVRGIHSDESIPRCERRSSIAGNQNPLDLVCV